MTTFDMPKAGTWPERGGWVVNQLVKDFQLTPEQAAGLVGNLGFESAGFTAFQQKGVPAGTGGAGWAQWTASRRVTFLDWCKKANLAPQSDEANYGFLCWELKNTHAYILTGLKKCKTLHDAVWYIGENYERPAGTTPTNLPGYDNRFSRATDALAGASQQQQPSDNATTVDIDLLADIVRAAQRVVGTTADGIMGPNTIAAIQEAQKK